MKLEAKQRLTAEKPETEADRKKMWNSFDAKTRAAFWNSYEDFSLYRQGRYNEIKKPEMKIAPTHEGTDQYGD